ncbi:MAG: DUF2911 domain-containing protein [Gemmatimonadota bacterium]
MKKAYLMATALLAAATPLIAQGRADSAAFIVRLGNDTLSIERYVRTDEQLVAEAVQRSPSTVRRRLVLNLSPAGLIPIGGPFYTPYELAIMRAVAAGTPKTNVSLFAGNDTVVIPIERVGSDSVALTNQFGEPMRAHIDARGRLLHLHTPAFTTVERVKWVDLDRLVEQFAARDAAGKGLGILSPRQTYRTRVGEANVWVDYSRPALRGRPIWGGLVPYGEVWRTGANEATHLAVDRTIQLGSLTLEPGTYTLFLLPAANDWTLIVNKQTGMSGLGRDPAQDIGRVTLTRETLEKPAELFTIMVEEVAGAGRLSMAWDRMRGWAPLSVR